MRHTRLKYKFYLIFNNSQKMWKNVSQYFSCFTFHEAAIQNSHWFCSEKSFEIRSTPGIMLGLFTFRYFVCSYNDSVRGILLKTWCQPRALLNTAAVAGDHGRDRCSAGSFMLKWQSKADSGERRKFQVSMLPLLHLDKFDSDCVVKSR